RSQAASRASARQYGPGRFASRAAGGGVLGGSGASPARRRRSLSITSRASPAALSTSRRAASTCCCISQVDISRALVEVSVVVGGKLLARRARRTPVVGLRAQL